MFVFNTPLNLPFYFAFLFAEFILALNIFCPLFSIAPFFVSLLFQLFLLFFLAPFFFFLVFFLRFLFAFLFFHFDFFAAFLFFFLPFLCNIRIRRVFRFGDILGRAGFGLAATLGGGATCTGKYLLQNRRHRH